MVENETQITHSEVEKQPAQEQNDLQAQKKEQMEYNYRVLRERAEAAEARMAEMEKSFQQKSQPSAAQEDHSDDDLDVDPDSYIEAKHFKKSVSKLKTELRETKKQLQEVANKAILSATESKLKSSYQDFDQIVSQENLRNLAAIHPEDYQSMMANPDLYAKSKTAYNMIKNYGISQEKIKQADDKIAANKEKPQSSSSVSPHVPDSVLGRFGDADRRVLTEAQKEEVRKRLAEAKKWSR